MFSGTRAVVRRVRWLLFALGMLGCDVASTEIPAGASHPEAVTAQLPPLVHRTVTHVRDAAPMQPLELTPDSAFASWQPRATRHVDPSRQVFAATMPSQAARLVPPIEDATLDMTAGSRLLEALDALPEHRRALGLEGMAYDMIYGSAGRCEPLHLVTTTEHDGESYELRYRAEPFTWMTAPQVAYYALPSSCADALLASAGAVTEAVGNGCTLEDQAAHFPAGSACRTCLTVDGDHARCVTDGACSPEAPRRVGVRVGVTTHYHYVLEADALGCAPDVVGRVILLARQLGEGDTPPGPFDHDAISNICQWAWDERSDRSRLYCVGATGELQPAYADVMVGRVDAIRRAGDSRGWLRDRTMLTTRVELLGRTFEAMPLFPNTLGAVSVRDPMIGGWGFHPDDLRADGSDPGDIDHTLAREWVGAIALKTTTRIDGVPIVVYNRNLCRDDQWKGPDAQGRYHCTPDEFGEENPPPDAERWNYDWGAYLVASEPMTIEILPFVTLGATGRMDPSIPGGHVPHVLGTPVLADPDWEGCAWPEIFVPDEKASVDSDAGVSTFTSQTYRFGKDPERDIRLVLATNWRRGFCFEPLPGDG